MSNGLLTLNSFLAPLLKAAGISSDRKIKLYKHVNHHHEFAWQTFPANHCVIDVKRIYQAGLMPEFQAAHSGRKYGDDIVLFFIAEDGSNCRFIGGFEIKKVFEKGDHCKSELAERAIQHKLYTPHAERWFDLQQISTLDCLIDRLEISWTKGRDNRWLNPDDDSDIEFVQILPKGSIRPFPGFTRLVLTYDELCKVIARDGDPVWQKVLSTTKGVYLINDTASGSLYIGSATGGDGFLGRWRQYAKTEHGGNKNMILALEGGLIRVNNFQLSILETMSNLSTQKEGLEAEASWKSKLGRLATNLNAN